MIGVLGLRGNDNLLTICYIDAVFDDVDEADLELDNMNSGQSHRQRMKAELEASSNSRGDYATRGSRRGQLARGGGSRSASRLGYLFFAHLLKH
jgi:hypothetical protein